MYSVTCYMLWCVDSCVQESAAHAAVSVLAGGWDTGHPHLAASPWQGRNIVTMMVPGKGFTQCAVFVTSVTTANGGESSNYLWTFPYYWRIWLLALKIWVCRYRGVDSRGYHGRGGGGVEIIIMFRCWVRWGDCSCQVTQATSNIGRASINKYSLSPCCPAPSLAAVCWDDHTLTIHWYTARNTFINLSLDWVFD